MAPIVAGTGARKKLARRTYAEPRSSCSLAPEPLLRHPLAARGPRSPRSRRGPRGTVAAVTAAALATGASFSLPGSAAGGPPSDGSSALRLETDLAGRVDVDDLDQDLLAFLQLVAHVLDAVVRDLGDVQQAVGARP